MRFFKYLAVVACAVSNCRFVYARSSDDSSRQCDKEIIQKVSQLFPNSFECKTVEEDDESVILISLRNPKLIKRYERSKLQFSTDDFFSQKMFMKVGLSILDASVLPVVGLLIHAVLVPLAMQYFGLIVPGIGTIHASYAMRGVAAILQKVSHFLRSWIVWGLSWLFSWFGWGLSAILGWSSGNWDLLS